MTVEEIFGKISAHMVEGMMFHEQMSDYYGFLGLDGYRCCHKYHYICETVSRAKVHKFYIDNYNKLLIDNFVNSGSIIPTGWNKLTRFDVDPATKRTAVKNGLAEWHKWEKSTVELYSQMLKELYELGEMAAYGEVKKLLKDAIEEVRFAEKKTIHLTALNFDMSDIYDEQDDIYKCYHKKLKCVSECLEECG